MSEFIRKELNEMKKKMTAMTALVLSLLLSVSAGASNFTSSVTAKPAPEVVQVQSSSGEAASAVITDANGNEVYSASENSEIQLVITPVSQKDAAVTEEISLMLSTAESSIEQSESVANLTVEVSSALTNLKETNSSPSIQELTVDDLVVCDLFDVSLVRNGNEVVDLEEGQSSVFYLQTNLQKGDVFFILHNYEGAQWEVIEDVELLDNGVLKVALTSHSPLAIIMDSNAYLLKPNGSTSPATGASDSSVQLMAAALCLTGAVVLFTRKHKGALINEKNC